MFSANAINISYPNESLITLCKDCHREESEYAYADKLLLLRALGEKQCLADEINSLACDISMAHFQEAPQIIIKALGWALRTPEAQQRLVSEYNSRRR